VHGRERKSGHDAWSSYSKEGVGWARAAAWHARHGGPGERHRMGASDVNGARQRIIGGETNRWGPWDKIRFKTSNASKLIQPKHYLLELKKLE
jgi:hypothetical protein